MRITLFQYAILETGPVRNVPRRKEYNVSGTTLHSPDICAIQGTAQTYPTKDHPMWGHRDQNRTSPELFVFAGKLMASNTLFEVHLASFDSDIREQLSKQEDILLIDIFTDGNFSLQFEFECIAKFVVIPRQQNYLSKCSSKNSTILKDKLF